MLADSNTACKRKISTQIRTLSTFSARLMRSANAIQR
jgi:hypothetical protein